MGLLECASGISTWRGYEYFEWKKVVGFEKIGENIFSAKVAGSSGEPYSVELHIDHPRRSKCSCPHADGKRIICKHIVATYFTVFPKEAEKFYDKVMSDQEEEEKRQKDMGDKLIEYVCNMKKVYLCQILLELLFDGPEWQYDRFIREHGLDNDWE